MIFSLESRWSEAWKAKQHLRSPAVMRRAKWFPWNRGEKSHNILQQTRFWLKKYSVKARNCQFSKKLSIRVFVPRECQCCTAGQPGNANHVCCMPCIEGACARGTAWTEILLRSCIWLGTEILRSYWDPAEILLRSSLRSCWDPTEILLRSCELI